MKKLLILLFSLLISLNSYGEWTEISESNVGDTYYLDLDSIKENNGYVYFWTLMDSAKPNIFGDLSSKVLTEAICNVPYKERGIEWHYYKLPMGQGSPDSNNVIGFWNYPSPGDVREAILEFVCEY